MPDSARQQQSGPQYELDAGAFLSEPRRTRAERAAAGRERQASVPLASHAEAPSLDGRPDPVAILRAQESEREPALVPLRYERMAATPFTFLRGAAAVMASDLSRVPTSGISVQLCGDAHVSNFGMFASAERDLVFDVNDFDETLPGPFDWDVKRLAASAAVAVLDVGGSEKRARRAAKATVTSYRETMAALSAMRTMDVWNVKLSVDALAELLGTRGLRAVVQKAAKQARRSTADTAVAKLTETVDGRRRFRSDPPILIPVPEGSRDEVVERLTPVYADYLRTLQPDRVALMGHYSFVDIAHKVVGVGSVGNLAILLLLESGDGEPLILQVKQANASVLEPYLGASRFDNHGKRVVVGQRVMQATGDPFLGWIRAEGERVIDFYLRQLRDMKGSIDLTRLGKEEMSDYVRICGAVLARAHARVGDSSGIAGYLGDTDAFDEAVAEFAMAYAAITVSDHAALVAWRGSDAASA